MLNVHDLYYSAFYAILQLYAPVAQWIRVFGFEPKGRRFESCRAYHQALLA